MNKSHKSSTYKSWSAIRDDLAKPLSVQLVRYRSAATALFLSSGVPILRKELRSETPFRAEMWPNITRSNTPVQKGHVENWKPCSIFEEGETRRCKHKTNDMRFGQQRINQSYDQPNKRNDDIEENRIVWSDMAWVSYATHHNRQVVPSYSRGRKIFLFWQSTSH